MRDFTYSFLQSFGLAFAFTFELFVLLLEVANLTLRHLIFAVRLGEFTRRLILQSQSIVIFY